MGGVKGTVHIEFILPNETVSDRVDIRVFALDGCCIERRREGHPAGQQGAKGEALEYFLHDR